MEPLDDRELKAILERWQAPDAPARLRDALFPRQPWRARFWGAQIRIPVPVAVCVALATLIALLLQAPPPRAPDSVTLVSFSELQPVKELKPRIIKRHNE